MSTSDPTPTPGPDPEPGPGEAVPRYAIRVAGRLSPRWSAWFDGLTVAAEPDGTTVLRGPVVDQAALHGLLHRLRDLGVPLLSLTRVPPGPERSPDPADPRHPADPPQEGELP